MKKIEDMTIEMDGYKLTVYSKRKLFKRAQWFWRLKSPNGRIIGGSTEGYNNRDECLLNIMVNNISLNKFNLSEFQL